MKTKKELAEKVDTATLTLSVIRLVLAAVSVLLSLKILLNRMNED